MATATAEMVFENLDDLTSALAAGRISPEGFKAELKKLQGDGTVCPVGFRQFVRDAKPLDLTLKGVAPLVMSTGSFGWSHSEKRSFDVAGTSVKCQVQVTITAIKSKERPDVDDAVMFHGSVKAAKEAAKAAK